jgi:hypothetical protein
VSIANRSGREQFRQIVEEFWHPLYRGGASSYDIALMLVDRPLVFNDFVQPIPLPLATSSVPSSGEIIAFGWGITTPSPPGVLPDELQACFLIEKYSKNLLIR